MRTRRLLGAVTVAVLALGTCVSPSTAAALPQHGYVTTSLRLPTTSDEARAFSRDMDRDGTPDNALGTVFAAMLQASSGSLDFNDDSSAAITNGQMLMTHSLRAASLRRTKDASWQVWYAEPTAEPPVLDGGTFTLPLSQPRSKRLPATIKRHKVRTAAGNVPVQLDLGGGPFTLELTQAKIRATCYASGCRHGKVSGALTASDIDQVLVPALQSAFQAVVIRDCPNGTESCASDSEGQTLLEIFDGGDSGDGNGSISEDEVRENSLLTTLLAPDLDLRKANGKPGKDGVMDAISFGVGFESVKATLVRTG